MKKFTLLFFLITGYAFAHNENLFPKTLTIDATPVSYVALSSEQMDESSHSVAFAKYDQTGAYIFYDKELFKKISPFAKFLIIEHERAHHILGHSMISKINKEANNVLENQRLFAKKENDADCEAGFRALEAFPEKTTSDISKAMSDIFYAISGSTSPDLPIWVLRRINKVVTCFEGQLLPRPKPLNSPKLM